MAVVLDLKGKQVGDIQLSDKIFAKTDETQAAGTMHAALVRQLGNARVGSANTKTRSEVRGGGAKPWRQKGTGRARAGSRRSPLWAGGGVTFGPKPRDYYSSMPVKMRHSAIKSALAVQSDNLVVVNDFSSLKEIKTKEAAKVLQALKIKGKKVLFVVEPKNEDSQRFGLSIRNMANVTVVRANNIGVKELLDCEAILTSQGAIEFITNWLTPAKKESKIKKQVSEKAPAKAKAESKEVKSESKAVAKNKTAAGSETSASVKAEKTEVKSSTLQSVASTSTKAKIAEKAPAKEKDVDLPPMMKTKKTETKGKDKSK